MLPENLKISLSKKKKILLVRVSENFDACQIVKPNSAMNTAL